MTNEQLQQWMQHPESLNSESLYELRTLVARYPYFQALRLLYLKNLYILHDATFGAELRKSVFYVADRRVLFFLIEGDRYILKPQVGTQDDGKPAEEPTVDRTLFLIDSFLSSVQPENPSPAVALDYAVDYTAYLQGQEDAESGEETPDEVPKLRGQSLIDDFLSRGEESIGLAPEAPRNEEPGQEKVNKPVGIPEADADEEEDEPLYAGVMDDSYFTETLAKIYIKQQRYEKALEIIKKLSLNYPKKNAYFADQIRFLEKLIINAKSK